MVDYSKWDALDVSSDDDDYADKPNSKEAYRRIKARQRRESRDEAEKAARDAAVALNEELPSDQAEAAAIAKRQEAAAPRTAKPRWRPGHSDPIAVKAPNDAAFAATFLEPSDFKEKPVILPEPYEAWDFRVSIPLESTCPYSWPEIDKTFAQHGEGAGLYVQDSRTFGPDCLIVHVAQFRWWLRSVEEAQFYWDDTLSVSKTEEDNDPELHMCCRRCNDFRGKPVRLDGADDSLVLRSQKYNNGCVAFNLLFRVGCVCAKVFLVVATPGTLAEDSFQGHAVRAGELAVAKVRSGPGCVS